MDPAASLTYADDVGYTKLDHFKRACLEAALRTRRNPVRLGVDIASWSYGESAVVLTAPNVYAITHVNEGLGTKNLVADAVLEGGGDNYWATIAQDTVAMIVNDLVTVGSLPACVNMHLAVESDAWFENVPRWEQLIAGWERACHTIGCAWGGGETPALRDVIVPGASLVAGSAVGVIRRPEHVIRESAITPGDSIVFLASSGIHANGISLPRRRIAPCFERGLRTSIDDARTLGGAILTPTVLYTPAIEALQNAGVLIHYTINVTGHGLRKLMRAVAPFTYIVNELPEPDALFRFIEREGPVELREMYATFNMGVGFALIVAPRDAARVIDICERDGIAAHEVGHVEQGPKRVILRPVDIIFEADTLQVR
jgi:phosphoribosylformylglycinamidine cyclo-ligase